MGEEHLFELEEVLHVLRTGKGGGLLPPATRLSRAAVLCCGQPALLAAQLHHHKLSLNK
jgi:hypothetical protein